MAISDLSNEQLEEYAKISNSWKEFMTKCGYTNYGCRRYIHKKVDELHINVSHFKRLKINKEYTNELIFKENSEYNNGSCIKRKLIKEFGWNYVCSNCKLFEWMSNKIPLEVDHINGNHTDNRIENLRFLCPNCHALTDTYKAKNFKNKEQFKDKYLKINENKKCKNCGEVKYKYSSLCKPCHLKTHIKENKNIKENIKENKCIECDKIILKTSTRCKQCYYKSINIKNMNVIKENNCVDCEKNILKPAVRCKQCYNISVNMQKLNKINKDNNKNTCIDCSKNIGNLAKRCTDCYIINSRKVIRPSYEQLLEDKSILNMVQIGKKYNVSDNTIRKWLKRYNMIESK